MIYVFLLEDQIDNNENETEELFISLACQVVRDYPKIILEYNKQLSGCIKEDLTFLINNLQICSQLEDRISDLQEGIERLEKQIKSNNHLKEERKSRLRLKKEDFKQSISIKRKKIKKFNQENNELLIKIGKSFYQDKLLAELDEFSRLYKLIDFFQN